MYLIFIPVKELFLHSTQVFVAGEVELTLSKLDF